MRTCTLGPVSPLWGWSLKDPEDRSTGRVAWADSRGMRLSRPTEAPNARHSRRSGPALAAEVEARRALGTQPREATDGFVRLPGGDLYPAVSRGQHLAELKGALRARRASRVVRASLGAARRRHVVVVGAGPTGLVAAIQAYMRGHSVTLVEQRTEPQAPPQTLNLRTEVRAALAQIHPDLFREVWAVATLMRWAEVVQDGQDTQVASSNPLELLFNHYSVAQDSLPAVRRTRPRSPEEMAARALAPERRGGNAFSADTAPPLSEGIEYAPARHAASQSTWQVAAYDLVRVLWRFIERLEKEDEAHGERRLEMLRGWQVTALPVAEEGEARRRVVIEPSNASGEASAAGRERRDLGVPDDILLADGANSKLVSMVGSGFTDVGPNTRFVAGLIDRFALVVAGNGSGVVRRETEVHKVPGHGDQVLRHIVMSQARGQDSRNVWALVEVPSDLDFADPASVQRFFGEALSEDDATRQYFALKVLPLVNRERSDRGLEPEDLLAGALPYGPRAFVVQSRIAGQPNADAQNVHCIGDAKGSSHFLASLGASTGMGPDQLALRLYWDACARKGIGGDTALEELALERRLFNNVRHWLDVGLSEFNGVTAANLGADVSKRTAATNGTTRVAPNHTSEVYRPEYDPSLSGHVARSEGVQPRVFGAKRQHPQRVVTAPAARRLDRVEAMVGAQPGTAWSLIPSGPLGGQYGCGPLNRYVLRDLFFDETRGCWTIQRLDSSGVVDLSAPERIITESYRTISVKLGEGVAVVLSADDPELRLGDEDPHAERRKELARRLALPDLDPGACPSPSVSLSTIGPVSKDERARTIPLSGIRDLVLDNSTWVVTLRSGEMLRCQAVKLGAGGRSAFLPKEARAFRCSSPTTPVGTT
ncbi:MAG: NAD(P)/FAD-dependent oxidoreductase [Deltaproteobacteria bacterium]|nr:NAD(P)/FAD-dependent oxidoreductase [Deltaproteobacteria bacterium]